MPRTTCSWRGSRRAAPGRSGRFSAVMPIVPSPWRYGWCKAAPTPRTSFRTPSFASGPMPRAGAPAGRAFPLGCIGSSSTVPRPAPAPEAPTARRSRCSGRGGRPGAGRGDEARRRGPTQGACGRRASAPRPAAHGAGAHLCGWAEQRRGGGDHGYLGGSSGIASRQGAPGSPDPRRRRRGLKDGEDG